MIKTIVLTGVSIGTILVPEVQIPEYIAFGGIIEMACNSAISIMGVFAAYVVTKTLWVKLKDKEFNLNKKQNDEKENNLKEHMTGVIKQVVNAMKNNN